jgi:hypothetical protein
MERRRLRAARIRDNTESTARQYGLVEEAAHLGWAASAIEVIDADLGLSGRSAENRAGFKEVVAHRAAPVETSRPKVVRRDDKGVPVAEDAEFNGVNLDLGARWVWLCGRGVWILSRTRGRSAGARSITLEKQLAHRSIPSSSLQGEDGFVTRGHAGVG